MNRRKVTGTLALILAAGWGLMAPSPVLARDWGPALSPIEQLGKALFFDRISDPDSMSCAACHAPQTGWTGPIPGINKHGSVYRGAVPQRFGNRKPPSAAYATCSPQLQYVEDEEGGGLFVGGNFWDGRATGRDLGNPAADQARGPFLNPVEQHNYDKQAVCDQVARSRYEGLFETVFGEAIDCSPAGGLDESYDRIAIAIGAYENSAEVNPFSSKYDAFLAGNAQLTDQETWGLELFEREDKGNCAACHPSRPGPLGQPPLFTDFTFDNLGVPRNPANPFYRMDGVNYDNGDPINPEGRKWVDKGLGGFLAKAGNTSEWQALAHGNTGKHKVPTLRNVAKTQGKETPKAFMHNGYFKTLKGVVNFYNTRDVKPACSDPFVSEEEALRIGCWPGPEVAANVNTEELGNLGLTNAEEDAIVAFMETLSDGYSEPMQQWACEYTPDDPWEK